MCTPPSLDPTVRYPSQNDLTIARNVDQSYGDPSAPFITPNNAKMRITPNADTMAAYANNDAELAIKPVTVDQKMSDEMGIAWLASGKSPVAALGFDPRKISTAVPSEGAKEFNIAGQYTPSTDSILTMGAYNSTIVHESTHRGLEMLRKAGMMPKKAEELDEEKLTRLFMMKHFGEIEKGRGKVADDQIKYAIDRYKYNPDYKEMMDQIEAAAQKLISQRKGLGPK